MVEERPDEARRLLHNALLSDCGAAYEILGKLAYQKYMDWLEEIGDSLAAKEARVRASIRANQKNDL